jgi:exosortase K
MSRKTIWSAQLLLLVLCALALKLFYSTASADELRWILGPTTALVELFSGKSFQFESYTGYMISDHTFVIAAPCAGVNFLLTSFLMIGLMRLWRTRYRSVNWRFFPLTAAIAYLATVIANTARICIALELQKHSVEFSPLTGNQLHRLEGIVVYFGFLMLLFVLVERFESAKRQPLLPALLFPISIYYAITLAIPLLNGSYRQGAAFWEHFAFVLVLPLVLIGLVMLFCAGRRAVRASVFSVPLWLNSSGKRTTKTQRLHSASEH